jgi:hypothetical protein
MMNREDIRTSLLDNLDSWGSAIGITVQGDLDWLIDQVAELIATELDDLADVLRAKGQEADRLGADAEGIGALALAGQGTGYHTSATEARDRALTYHRGE